MAYRSGMIWVTDSMASALFQQRWLDFTARTLDQEFGYGWVDAYPEDRDACAATTLPPSTRRNFQMEHGCAGRREYRSCSAGIPRFTRGAFPVLWAAPGITDLKRARNKCSRPETGKSKVRAEASPGDFNNLLGGSYYLEPVLKRLSWRRGHGGIENISRAARGRIVHN